LDVGTWEGGFRVVSADVYVIDRTTGVERHIDGRYHEFAAHASHRLTFAYAGAYLEKMLETRNLDGHTISLRLTFDGSNQVAPPAGSPSSGYVKAESEHLGEVETDEVIVIGRSRPER